ncbi:carbohydrate kinase [Desulfosarcina sp.]|uniref:carbohydrate kinase family protein n=1 Tax=Desulfosarcina sp. TaxID=2027861 RepID=UPI00356A6121
MIVVIGEILIDIFQDYERIGGAPFNFAFHLKKLGFPVRFLTRVGNDRHGRRIIDRLEKNGFNLADVQMDSRHGTGTVRVDLNQQGIPHFDIRANAAYDHLDLNSADVSGAKGADMIYFGTLLQRTGPACHQVQRFLSHTNKAARRFCDINLRPPHVNPHAVAGSLRHADLLKVNEAELAHIQRVFDGPPAENEVMPWLMETFTIGAVALTRGSRGSVFYSHGGPIASPTATNVRIVDTVGAGDGYAAILAAGCLRQVPWAETLRQASDFAARICGIAGAVPDDDAFYHDIRPLMKGETDGR